MNDEGVRTIGRRLGMIRRRRGVSQVVVAGLAGITKQYLSLLERGERGFNRRGLIEDLAEALSCSVADLTRQPDAISFHRLLGSADSTHSVHPVRRCGLSWSPHRERSGDVLGAFACPA